MTLMIVGLILWSLVHLMPSLSSGLRNKLIAGLGQTGYRLAFSVLILASLALIVLGWRSIVPVDLYATPEIVRIVAMLLIVIAFFLFGAVNYPTRIKQFIRNPQLTGVVVWSTAHLLLNGDNRSVWLFSWLGIWALLEIMLINRRSGEWIKSASPSWAKEALGAVISLIVFVVIVWLHPYIAGVSIY
ncbi:MAG: NnrU family protein [Gammaproteobacteria bacterium]|nr:NnrU family protein [Gammaproteobacteria bacterium]